MNNYNVDDLADNLSYLANTKNLIKNAIIEKGQDINSDTTFREYAAKISNISGGGTTGYIFNTMTQMNSFSNQASDGDYGVVYNIYPTFVNSSGRYSNVKLFNNITFDTPIVSWINNTAGDKSGGDKFTYNIGPNLISLQAAPSILANYYNFISNDGIHYTFDALNSSNTLDSFSGWTINVNYAPELSKILFLYNSTEYIGAYSYSANTNVWSALPNQFNTVVTNILNGYNLYSGSKLTGNKFNTTYVVNNISNKANMLNFINEIQPVFTGINANVEYVNASNLFNGFKGYYIPPIKVSNLSHAFYNCTNLVTVKINSNSITNLSYAFYNCTNLVYIEGDNLSIINSYYVFNNCANLIDIPKCTFLDEKLYYTFNNCVNLQNYENIDIGNVTNIYNSFYGWSFANMNKLNYSSVRVISQLHSNFNIAKLNQINMKNVYSISYLYKGLTNITSIPNFDTSSVINICQFVNNTSNITSIPNYNFGKVEDAYYAFTRTNITTTPNWNLCSLVKANCMFLFCNYLTTVPAWNTINMVDSSSMFYGDVLLVSVGNFKTSNLFSAVQMFDSCRNITSLPNFDFHNLKFMNYICNNCRNLTTVPAWNTINVLNLTCSFAYCNNLSNASIQNIINMCLNSNIPSTRKNLMTNNMYSPFNSTNITNSRYSNRLSQLSAAGWTY